MFDFSQVQREDLKLALGAAIGIGVAAFFTSDGGLTGRFRFAMAMALVAGFTVVLFMAVN